MHLSDLVLTTMLVLLLVACGGPGATSTGDTGGVSVQTAEPTQVAEDLPTTSTDVGGSGSDGSSQGYSAGKLLSAASWHFVISREVESNGQVLKESAEGDIDRVKNALHYTFTSPKKGSSSEYDPNGEWVHVEGQSYQKRNGKWEKDNFQWVVEDMELPSTFSPPNKDTEPQLIGSETIYGQETDHYRYTAEFKGYAGSTYDAWISKSSGDLVRVHTATPDGTLKYSTTFSKWDEPVTIPDTGS